MSSFSPLLSQLKPHRFIEIKGAKPTSVIDELPDKVEAYVTIIEPKLCKTLLKELASFMPLVKVEEKVKMVRSYNERDNNFCSDDNNNDHDAEKYIYWKNCIPLGHLRRVRRHAVVEDEIKDQLIDDHHAKVSPTRGDVDEPKSITDHTSPLTEPPAKRSRKQKKKGKNKSSSNNDKINIRLEVLLGAVSEIDKYLFHQQVQNDNDSVQTKSKGFKLQQIIQSYNLKLNKKDLPGRPAKSQAELLEWNQSNWWPTLYFAKQSDEFKESELELDLMKEEYGTMTQGMKAAFSDAKMYKEHGIEVDDEFMYGAVIICPTTAKIISTSFDEMDAIVRENSCSSSDGDGNDCHDRSEGKYQQAQNGNSMDEEKVRNLLFECPLSTPVMFAIQGVSRKERKAAIGLGMDNDEFKNNQVRVVFSYMLQTLVSSEKNSI